MKTCRQCGEEKPLSEFHRDRGKSDGATTHCKVCACARAKAWNKANPERKRENARAWREANPEREKANARAWREANRERDRTNSREWYASNRERARARNAAWYEANKEQVKANARAWYRENKERAAAARRAYYEANREELREAYLKWKADNPERVRASNQRRRAIKAGVFVDDVDGDELWADQHGTCSLCGCVIDAAVEWPDPESKSLDHIVPLSKGGAHSQENVQWTHLRCNLRKGTALSTAGFAVAGSNVRNDPS